MTERIPCKNPDCKSMILPATAKSTGGYCMPCHYNKERLKHQQYVEENKQVVNLYENVTDPLEIIKIYHGKRKYNELIQYVDCPHHIWDVYSKLTENQKEQLIDFIIPLLEIEDSDDNETMDAHDADVIALCLRNYTSLSIDRLLDANIAKNRYYSEEIFRNCGDSIVEKLVIKFKKKLEPYEIRCLLPVLAWIDNEQVTELFEHWKQNPPEWSDEVYMPAHQYAHCAGHWGANFSFCVFALVFFSKSTIVLV